MSGLRDTLAFYGIGPQEKTSSARSELLLELKRLQPLYVAIEKTSGFRLDDFLAGCDRGDFQEFEAVIEDLGPREAFAKISSRRDHLRTLCEAEDAGRQLAIHTMKAVFESERTA